MSSIVEDLTWGRPPLLLGDAASRVSGLWKSYGECSKRHIVFNPNQPDGSLVYFKGDEDATYRAYDLAEGRILANVAQEALDFLDRASPNAFLIVDRALVRIVLRRDSLYTHPHSSSWRTRPGLTAITNAESSSTPVLFMVNAFVHEAIHSALYCWEMATPFILSSTSDVRIISPWTGARLRVDSYIHACHVWFGLAQLWHRTISDGETSGDIERFYLRARAGFDSDVIAPLEGILASIGAHAVDAMREIQSRSQALPAT